MKRPLRPLAMAITLTMAASAGVRAAPIVLENATLIDGTGQEPVSPAAVIIGENGRIAWTGRQADLRRPAGARTVDATGKFVLPGLIDAHVHLGAVRDQVQDEKFYSRASVEDDLKTFAAYGVTSVASYGTDKDLIFDIRREQRAGLPRMARVFTAGQGLVYQGGYGGVLGINQPVATAEQAVKAVDAQASKGVDLIKFWVDDEVHMIPVKMPAEISGAIIMAAHRHHLKAVAHIYYLADAKQLVEQGVDGFAHEVRDAPVDDALLTAMKTHGTWQAASTLSREAAFSWAVMPFLDDPFFQRGVTPGTLEYLRSPAREKKQVLGEVQVAGLPYKKAVFWDYDRSFWQALKNFAAVSQAGIHYGMGTDSGAPSRFPGFNAHEELELLIMDGLTPMQAIVAATSSNARWLGAEDLGVIAKGKWADLLVLDANPLDDIRNTRKIAAVYIAGNPVTTIWEACRYRDAADCPAPSVTHAPTTH